MTNFIEFHSWYDKSAPANYFKNVGLIAEVIENKINETFQHDGKLWPCSIMRCVQSKEKFGGCRVYIAFDPDLKDLLTDNQFGYRATQQAAFYQYTQAYVGALLLFPEYAPAIVKSMSYPEIIGWGEPNIADDEMCKTCEYTLKLIPEEVKALLEELKEKQTTSKEH